MSTTQLKEFSELDEKLISQSRTHFTERKCIFGHGIGVAFQTITLATRVRFPVLEIVLFLLLGDLILRRNAKFVAVAMVLMVAGYYRVTIACDNSTVPVGNDTFETLLLLPQYSQNL